MSRGERPACRWAPHSSENSRSISSLTGLCHPALTTTTPRGRTTLIASSATRS